MGRFRNYIFAVAGFVILAGAFTVIGPYVNQGQADPPVKNVAVVNTPLPVTGILVGDVRVTNTTAEPVPVEVQSKTLDIVEIIENNVPRSTVVNVFTVPANRRLIITDLVISVSVSTAGQTEILRNGSPATSFIATVVGNAFSHTFATGIEFVAGETVAVSSGIINPAAGVHFYLRGYLTTE